MCSGDLPSECACVCVAFLLTAHFAFKGHLVIGAARGASCELRLRVRAYLNIRGGGWLPNLDATTDPRCGMEWHAPVAAASSSISSSSGGNRFALSLSHVGLRSARQL